ncbi:MAG: hypothetical protein QUS09_09125 [Methanotrichaceae archaeon]|nr:hypothetical protein [Methanotrichaceae archaeon]
MVEIWHIRCPLCGKQVRISDLPPQKPRIPPRRPQTRIQDGPYPAEVRVQKIGGSLPGPRLLMRQQSVSEWGKPEPPTAEQLALLRDKLAEALALVESQQAS